jgi:hypothetical protein
MNHLTPSFTALQQWWQARAKAHPELRALQREIDKFLRHSESLVQQSVDQLFPGETWKQLEAPMLRLLCNFALADAIANHYKGLQKHGPTRIATFVSLTTAAVWAFQHGDALAKGWPVVAGGLNAVQLTGLVGIVLFTALSFLSRFRFQKLRHNFLIARSLAEAIRVDLFQRIGGTGFDTLQTIKAHHETGADPSVIPAALEATFDSCGFSAHPRSDPPSPLAPEDLKRIREHWLDDQMRYFQKAASLERKVADSAESLLSSCLFLTATAIIISLLLLILPNLLQFPLVKTWLRLEPGQIAAGSFLPPGLMDLLTPLLGILAAFFHQKSAEHAIISQKYSRAVLMLSQALTELEKKDPREVLESIGRQAISETSDWGVHQREQSRHIAFR